MPSAPQNRGRAQKAGADGRPRSPPINTSSTTSKAHAAIQTRLPGFLPTGLRKIEVFIFCHRHCLGCAYIARLRSVASFRQDVDARDALGILKQGNRRFVQAASGHWQDSYKSFIERRPLQDLAEAQQPLAAVLGCSDSRVPPEIVFDQWLGDLFVVRVAGNVAGPTEIGSIEFAVATLHTHLVVVLGHSHCGAVSAALDAILDDSSLDSPNLESLLKPTIATAEKVVDANKSVKRNEILEKCIRANIRQSVQTVIDGSQILNRFVRENELLVVGAEYDLRSGTVVFFED
ncbi:MAG: hypothetical protein C4319_03170 [Acidimicrobiia bacterium]